MDVKKAVCNAVLDLSITSLACQRLLDVSALNYVMFKNPWFLPCI